MMINIRIKLAGAFRIDRFKEEVRSCPAGTRVADIVRGLQLPEQILGIYLVNGVHAELEDALHEGDSLSILPILDGG